MSILDEGNSKEAMAGISASCRLFGDESLRSSDGGLRLGSAVINSKWWHSTWSTRRHIGEVSRLRWSKRPNRPDLGRSSDSSVAPAVARRTKRWHGSSGLEASMQKSKGRA
ncbi:hypothetical protein M6B38_115670 [Iris pallida]|uniref:Uncharacterized protein n=1 Tax=Iris pallida TaxID=29817 RepID=A0AAX6I451_IRIPA|nr:hypothetical protein M6B38_115670 [Iris pallida]